MIIDTNMRLVELTTEVIIAIIESSEHEVDPANLQKVLKQTYSTLKELYSSPLKTPGTEVGAGLGVK